MKNVNTIYALANNTTEILEVSEALEIVNYLDTHPKSKIGNFEVKGYDLKLTGEGDGMLTVSLSPTEVKEDLLALIKTPEAATKKTKK